MKIKKHGVILLIAVSASAAAQAQEKRPPEVVERGRRPGDGKVNPKDGQRYVWIPPGTFMMGCSAGDSECQDIEKPSHPVTITKGFWMGQTDVTVGAWKRYRAATGKPALPTNDVLGRNNLNEASGDDNMPVTFVIWDEAQSYCEWEGGSPPTEAQWEYAARAGSTGARYGNLDDIAWYADNSGKQRVDSTEIFRTDQPSLLKRLFENGNAPHPVAQKQPNRWNLYDMLGNVWQWTSDWYSDYLPDAITDPSGPTSGQYRSTRGGSWFGRPARARVSDRDRHVPDFRARIVGLRCVWN